MVGHATGVMQLGTTLRGGPHCRAQSFQGISYAGALGPPVWGNRGTRRAALWGNKRGNRRGNTAPSQGQLRPPHYNGIELFVALTKTRRAITSHTISPIATKFFAEHNFHGLTAHSARGLPVTALIQLGVAPHIVFALGAWKSYDCFRLYHDLTSMFAQIPVPKPSQGDQPLLLIWWPTVC